MQKGPRWRGDRRRRGTPHLDGLGGVSWSSSTHCGLTLSSEIGESVLHSTLDLYEALSVPDDDEAKLAARAWAEGTTLFGSD